MSSDRNLIFRFLNMQWTEPREMLDLRAWAWLVEATPLWMRGSRQRVGTGKAQGSVCMMLFLRVASLLST